MKIYQSLKSIVAYGALIVALGCGQEKIKTTKLFYTKVQLEGMVYHVDVMSAMFDTSRTVSYDIRIFLEEKPGCLTIENAGHKGIMPDRVQYFGTSYEEGMPDDDPRRKLCGDQLKSLIEEALQEAKKKAK